MPHLIIDAGPVSTFNSFSSGDYVAGTEFTLSTSTTIDGLGFIDIGSDGLLEDHRVGLWDTSGVLLAEAIVTNASTVVASASSLGQWYVEQIADILLSPGAYRVAGIVGNEANALNGDKIGNGAILSSGYVRTQFPSGGFNYPGLSFGAEAVRATVTTNQFSQVPEPQRS